MLTSLPRPEHVAEVMRAQGALAALRPGSLWADLTTNRPALLAELAAEAPDGVEVVDSPVTGAVDGARNRRLTLFAGGSPAALDRAVPLLGTLGKVIRLRRARLGQTSSSWSPTSSGSSTPRPSARASLWAWPTAWTWR